MKKMERKLHSRDQIREEDLLISRGRLPLTEKERGGKSASLKETSRIFRRRAMEIS